MTPTYTAAVFTLSFLVTALVVSRHLRRPATILSRVLDPGKEKPAGLRSLSWSRILASIGSLQKARGQEKLRTSFMRAGIHSPRADTVFRGLKIVGAALGGIAVGAGALAEGVDPTRAAMLAAVGMAAGRMLPGEILRIGIRRRMVRIEKALPNALDLLTISVEAGLGLDQAIIQVSRELRVAHPEISDELSMISLEMRAGKRRADALRDFATRTGIAEVKKLSAVLIQADRFGTSIAQTLRVYSEHMRVQTRQSAEEKAAKLGVKLVFPIFFFILPSLFVITVGPVVVRIIFDLLPVMNSL